MTPQQYGSAYENGGYQRTLWCLKKRGIAHDEAENLAQSAWLRGLLRLQQLRDERCLRAWIGVIAINQLQTLGAPRLDQLQGFHESASTFEISFAVIDVRRAMERCCSLRQKRLLGLVYFKGFSCAEAGAKLEMSVGAVHQELTRVRAAMRKYLTSRS